MISISFSILNSMDHLSIDSKKRELIDCKSLEHVSSLLFFVFSLSCAYNLLL